MAKSLQEQLLEAGAVKKDRATKLKKAKHKQGRQQRQSGSRNNEAELAAKRAEAEKAARDKRLNQQQQADKARRALAAQIEQLVSSNRIPMSDGEDAVAFNFESDGKIKTVLLAQAQRSDLIAGKTALARSGQAFALLPASVAEKIIERDASAVAYLHKPDDDVSAEQGDDPYADYIVPDDLQW